MLCYLLYTLHRDRDMEPFLPSATKMWQGNIFTGVCQSVCSQREGVSGRHPPGRHPRADTPLGKQPLGRHPPWADTPLPSACWDTHPLPSACWDTHPLSARRYASYWNVFLFSIVPVLVPVPVPVPFQSRLVCMSHYTDIITFSLQN